VVQNYKRQKTSADYADFLRRHRGIKVEEKQREGSGWCFLVVIELPAVHPPLTPPSREGNKRKGGEKRNGWLMVEEYGWLR